MHARRVRMFALAAPVLGLPLTATVLAAQGFRITGTSLANYVELRPVIEDSIPDSLATGTGLVRQSGVGTVSCIPGHTWCYFYRSQERTHTIPLTQDVELTGWGLGQGVSVYAHVRARGNGGGATALWAREDDHFDALAAYLELDRDRWTARAGRQWLTSQLGLNNFDGLSLALRPRARLVFDGYVGSSLIQGLSEPPTSSVLAAVDLLPPDVRGVVVGATGRWRPAPLFAVGAEYQREIRSDRAGLYSERVAFDAAFAAGRTSVTGDAQADLASGALNELRLRASRPLRWGVDGSLEAVHSTPFFPLWTIWGVFSPVGYDEARASASWRSSDDDRSAALSGGYRRYQDTHTGVGFLPLRNDGWTVVASGAWRVRPDWEMTGSYRRDIGFGASKSDGNAGIRWDHRDRGWLGVTVSVLQNIYEFRVGNGYVGGAAIDGALPVTSSVRLAVEAGLYRHFGASASSTTVNWSQRRALVRLEWSAGRDPGMNALGASAGERRQ
ncbi:MAG TPA: hypothetical protein VFJ20_00680 [Gemmatimonadaceae bacterium]|nr:hypothetical protein [Gemmatimonadaceae bacterium]